jgi:hypothetical protein
MCANKKRCVGIKNRCVQIKIDVRNGKSLLLKIYLKNYYYFKLILICVNYSADETDMFKNDFISRQAAGCYQYVQINDGFFYVKKCNRTN